MEKLVGYLVDAPPEDADARREFKYPYLACEIFSCEIDAVFNALMDDDCALFARIMSFVDVDDGAALNPMLAGFFSKTVSCVVSRRRGECVAFFKKNENLVDALVRRVDVLAIAEVLLRLVGADDGVMPMNMLGMGMMGGLGGGVGGGGGDDGNEWLAETNLLDGLLDALGTTDGGVNGGEEREGDTSASRAANAAEVLVGIARAAPSALASKLAETASMTKLFERGLSSSPTSSSGYGVLNDGDGGLPTPTTAHGGASASPLVNVLDIVISVIDGKRAQGPAQAMQAFLAMESGAEPEPPREAPETATLACAAALPKLAAALETTCDISEQRTTWGAMSPPLGLKRVKIVDVIATLLASKHAAVADAVIACDALRTCANLFRAYPFNNFLHHHVESMVSSVLEWGHEGLLSKLFAPVDEGGCDVIGLVACAPQTVDSKRGPIRAGNLGHATNIANKLLRAAAAGSDGDGADADGGGAGISSEPPTITPPVPESVTAFVRAALAADARWASFEEGALRERNAIENVFKWQCGRPAGMDDDGAGASDDDDRDFDLGLGGGGFSRDVYNRYATGLDDDEDDEDEEEEEEEEEEELDDDDDGDGGGGGARARGAAGLFQGDAGARLASLTLKDYSSEEDDEVDGDADTIAVPSGPFGATTTAAAADDDDDVLLVDSDDDDSDGVETASPAARATDRSPPTSPQKSPSELLRSPTSPSTTTGARPGTPSPSKAATTPGPRENSEFNDFGYWGPTIDAGLVPDDV